MGSKIDAVADQVEHAHPYDDFDFKLGKLPPDTLRCSQLAIPGLRGGTGEHAPASRREPLGMCDDSMVAAKNLEPQLPASTRGRPEYYCPRSSRGILGAAEVRREVK